MRFDADKITRGWEGETIIRKILSSKGIRYMQADLLVKIEGGWQIWEVKRQEPFEPPPFYGHGLPRWQINARLKFQEDTGIRAVLCIVDSKVGTIYWQHMDRLIQGPSYQTTGRNPRLIFPLESYYVYKGDTLIDDI